MITLHTNFGDIILELDFEKAPETSANFEQYVRDGFYDGVIFHRVIDGFMIQGGGFEPGMSNKKTREPIQNEADNGLSNTAGTIAMARTMDPHSASVITSYSIHYTKLYEGFEAGLVGAEKGAEVELNVTFPETYHAENLKGKPALFKVKVQSVSASELPELNAEFFAKFGIDESDLDGFRAEVRKNMERA